MNGHLLLSRKADVPSTNLHAVAAKLVAASGATANTGVPSGIQDWSRGDLFPAVLSRVELYDTPATFEQWCDINHAVAMFDCASRLYQNYLRVFFARPLAERLIATSYRVLLDGREYTLATFDSAEAYARALLQDAKTTR